MQRRCTLLKRFVGAFLPYCNIRAFVLHPCYMLCKRAIHIIVHFPYIFWYAPATFLLHILNPHLPHFLKHFTRVRTRI